MSDLSAYDRRKLERLFKMGSGYVLCLSNESFAELVREHAGVDIGAATYCTTGSSKARRLRAFWAIESNERVATLLVALVERGRHDGVFVGERELVRDVLGIASRLMNRG
ncbi:hypothetical protein [Rhizobacter sp. P5_C2]